ncbi:AAA domain-containing protein [Xylogone sp. PMI_703]|nr:AAA domain-containing protein [Xylogone sp. PMI_703]
MTKLKLNSQIGKPSEPSRFNNSVNASRSKSFQNITLLASMALERITIIGKSGSGKTTLARELAEKLELRHVELDGLSWEENWVQAANSEMRERTDEALPTDGRWVADGNYTRVRDIVWTRADTLIWLDYPLRVALWRLLCRTIGRVVRQTELWNGNRENLWHHLTLDTDENLFLWTIKTHWKHAREYPMMLKQPEYSHLNVLRFRSPKELEEFVSRI